MRVIYQFMVPVHVEVEDGRVKSVIVVDEAPITDPTFVDGDLNYLPEAVESSMTAPWPAWRFGY
jgi:hypothetical protein